MTNFIKEYKSEINNVLYFILAMFINCTLHVQFIISASEPNSSAPNILRNLFWTYFTTSFIDILSVIALFLLIKFVFKNDKKFDKCAFGLSTYFSLSYILSKSYVLYDGVNFLKENNYHIFLSSISIIGYILFFYFCLKGLFIITDNIKKKDKYIKRNDFIHKHFLLFSFLLIIIGWSLWIIVSYPGTFNPDSTDQLMQFFKLRAMNAHHPPLSSFIMGWCVSFGNLIFNYGFGAFLYMLLQAIFGAFVFSFGINKLYENGIRLRYCIIAVLFFAFTTFWAEFAQWIEKDLLYTEAVTLFFIMLTDIIIKKELTVKNTVALTLVGILSSLLRNNGIYAILPTLFLTIFIFNKKQHKILIISSFISTIFLYGIVTNFLYPNILNIHKGSVREMLSVPLLQTARYVVNHENEVTKEEKEVINSVIIYDEIVKHYNPRLSDPIKDRYHGDNKALGMYFITWFKMFFKHPHSYISAFLNKNYGYIAPSYPSCDTDISYNYNDDTYYSFIRNDLKLHKLFGRSPIRFFNEIVFSHMNTPVIKYLYMPGLYTWILFICMALLLRRKIYAPLIIFTPSIINFLVCLASPLANSMRYSLPLVAATPLIVCWTYYLIINKENST